MLPQKTSPRECVRACCAFASLALGDVVCCSEASRLRLTTQPSIHLDLLSTVTTQPPRRTQLLSRPFWPQTQSPLLPTASHIPSRRLVLNFTVTFRSLINEPRHEISNSSQDQNGGISQSPSHSASLHSRVYKRFHAAQAASRCSSKCGVMGPTEGKRVIYWCPGSHGGRLELQRDPTQIHCCRTSSHTPVEQVWTSWLHCLQ